ncbi:MAG: FtsW/RodA/SpoVE family cell cycle protein [Anaerolineae bacterium]|nr:FtsW/RodA/SpoVE family cell cycle protein [Anaerolineae bacterium]
MALPVIVTPDEPAAGRRQERGLLLLAGAFLLVNFAALALLRPEQTAPWLHLLVWILCAGGGSLALERFLPERDPLLFPLVMFLSGWGLVLIDRLAPGFADRQTLWLALGTAALVVTAAVPHILRLLRTYRYTLLVVGLVLLISTILLGRNPSGFGPELWLGIGDVFFQPSEALKIILVAFLASYLSEQYPALRPDDVHRALFSERHLWLSPRILGPILLMWGVCVVVLVWQRDLGTAVLFFAVFLLLLYIASGQTLILVSGGVLIVAAAAVAYRLFDVVQLRIDIWLNPWLDPDGRAFQIVQSLMAFGSGGIFGQGVGQGAPDFIPVVHSDFALAALAEEWGLLGVVVVIVCVATLVMRGLRIAVSTQERPYYALLAAGLSLLIGIQSLLIMGGVLKLVPLTGVTLPFMSYGGSSLLMSCVLVGLLLRLSAGVRA